jgi:hypothetical protein
MAILTIVVAAGGVRVSVLDSASGKQTPGAIDKSKIQKLPQ